MGRRRLSLLILVIFLVFVALFFNDIRKGVSAFFFKSGEKYFSREKYDLNKAEKLYKIAIFVDSEYPVVHYQLGRIYFLNGNFPSAISEFDKELSNHPDFTKTYYMRGLTNGYAKKYKDAVSDFGKYIESNPSTWAGYNDLAWVYLTENDWQNAEKTAQEGLKNSPQNSWLLSNLGKAQIGLEKYQEAKENLILAQKYSENLSASDWEKTYPGNDYKIAQSGINEMKAVIFLNLAVADKKLGQKDEAKTYYQKYLDILPEKDARRIPIEYFMMMP
jgi:tetratricopeptide (TPR) repeat protein